MSVAPRFVGSYSHGHRAGRRSGGPPRKGQVYRRKGDGFDHVVVSASRAVGGAYLHALDATGIFNWYTDEQVARDFDRVPRAEGRALARAALERWGGSGSGPQGADDYAEQRRIVRIAADRAGAGPLRHMEVGHWYRQVFTDLVLYFHATRVQKNGGMAGVQFDLELDRPRATPRPKRSSVPRAWTSNWHEVDASEVPDKVRLP